MPSADAFAQLLSQRRSIRAYLPTPVADQVLHDIMIAARRAPSGGNLQPGHFIRVRGEARQQLTHDLVQAFRAGHDEPEDYDYFPKPMPMGLRRRQVAAAQALYESVGIGREQREARDSQFERNFSFFEAPVALVVTIDREFGAGGYMDLGMALYGLMLAAQSHGLATCGIGALASFPNLTRRHLGLEHGASIVCGMALGYEDPQAPVNRTRTARCTLRDFFRTVG